MEVKQIIAWLLMLLTVVTHSFTQFVSAPNDSKDLQKEDRGQHDLVYRGEKISHHDLVYRGEKINIITLTKQETEPLRQ